MSKEDFMKIEEILLPSFSTTLTSEECDYLVKIPMLGSVESLNVSVAAGVCLFDAVRQRSN